MQELNLQLEVTKVLQDGFNEIRARNPQYSLRAYAKKLGLSSAALSEIMNGRRRVSGKIAERIASALMLDPKRTDRLRSAAQTIKQQKRTARREQQPTNSLRPTIELSMDHFHTISDWYHYAILSLVQTKGFREDPQWIAKRLNITKNQAAQALERLERLGMLQRDELGVLRPTGVNYTSSDEVASLALRRAHMNNLELARASLERDALEARDFSAVTMAIDVTKLPEAKRRIRAFRQELESFLEAGESTEVYKFCLNLFPLSTGDVP